MNENDTKINDSKRAEKILENLLLTLIDKDLMDNIKKIIIKEEIGKEKTKEIWKKLVEKLDKSLDVTFDQVPKLSKKIFRRLLSKKQSDSLLSASEEFSAELVIGSLLVLLKTQLTIPHYAKVELLEKTWIILSLISKEDLSIQDLVEGLKEIIDKKTTLSKSMNS